MSFKLNTVFRNFVVKTKKQRKLKIILKQLAQYYHNSHQHLIKFY